MLINLARVRRCAIAVLLTILPLAANAITGKLYEYDKLTNSLVTQLCQDKYGYVWIASDFGLNRFDGYHFVNYYYSSRDSLSIPHNLVRSLLCTKDGQMFIGTGKGLARYDYTTDKFQRFRFPGDIQPRVNSLAEMPSGNLLVCTAGYGVYVLNRRDMKLSEEKSYSNLAANNYLSGFYVEDAGTVWCFTNDRRIVRFVVNGDKAVSFRSHQPKGAIPSSIINDSNGKPLFVMDNALMRYDAKGGRFMDAGYELPQDVRIISAHLGKNGNLYLGIAGLGLYVVNKGEAKAHKEETYNGHYLLESLVISDLMEDRNGNLWFTLPHDGVYLSSMSRQHFWTLDFNINGSRHNHGFTAITSDGAGGVYCVARHRGLYHMDMQGNMSKCLGAPNDCSTVMRDSKGRYWVGTWQSLYLYDPVTDKCMLFDDLDNKGTPYVAEDKLGNIYISVFGEGFAVYDGKSDGLRYYNSRTTAKDKVKFGNDWVGQMYCDHEGMMWITSSSGTWCFNPKTRKFVDLGGGDGILKDRSCTAVTETKHHNIVIGTESGVYVYDRKKRTTQPLPGGEAIEDMKIMGLVSDAHGDVWISTVKGIWQYDRQTRKLISHVGNSGIIDNEFCNGAFCRLPDDLVVFGANSNITAFYPDVVRSSHKVEGQVYLTRFATTTKVENTFADEFVIPWDDNRFTMEFSMLNYQNAAGISYEYRMNGGKWIAFDNDGNSLTFTKLNPGTYHIEVRATSNGWHSDDVKKLTVVVESPWYSSWTAIVIYLLLAVLLILYIGIGIRRRQRARFEEEKVKLLINATHDIRSPLTLILGPLEKLKSLVGKTSDTVNAKEMSSYVSIIERNAERLLLLVNQILDMRKIDKRQMRLKCKETDMVEFVEKSCKMFEYNAKENGYDFAFNHPEDVKIQAWIDRLHFEKVLGNLLSNAFKYTPGGGLIRVDLSSDEKTMTLRVIDSGVGISEEKPAKLFDRFYQGAANDATGIAGTGIGLNLARNVVEMHGGTISAANRTDGVRGACFTITLPLGNSHLKPEEIYQPVIEEQSSKKIIYQKCKIMIVDDDEELAAYTARELRQWYRIDVFNDGETAFKALLNGDYDLVVSDVMMPGIDGITLLKKIKSNPLSNHIPVILLTTKSEVEDRLAGIKSGADAYIDKPFSCEMLRASIDNLIDNMRRLRGKFSGAQQQHDKVEQVEAKGYYDGLMEKVMKSVNEHLADSDFTVDVLAGDVGMSRVQLHRKIKEKTGVSTGKFIRNIRMEQAGRLIKEGKINIADVAYKVGFNDQTYFSTVFKQYYGVPPSEYGKQ